MLFAACLLCVSLCGCAAVTNPTVDAIPVRRLPPELLFGRVRDDEITIPLSLLGQPAPQTYRLGPNDVIGVYIEGILGEPTQPLPVYFLDSPRVKAGIGYPISVREDGTIALPLVEPLAVEGKSLTEAEEAIRSAYIKAKLIQPGGKAEKRMLISLLRKRTYRVVVLRQEVGGFRTGAEAPATISVIAGITQKRGTGQEVDLPAYENDVLNALSLSGGLPGLDAYDDIFIMRNPSSRDRAALELGLQIATKGHKVGLPPSLDCPVVRIPLRVRPGEAPPLRPEDVILYSGDVVFVEARDIEVFYTAGLIPPGEFVLPRDHDLDVIEAISLAKGPLFNGAFAVSNLAGTIIQSGIGQPSPSLLTVIRQTPDHGQIAIRVDLNRAIRDPRERINVLPKDILVLQETPGEALVRYVTEKVTFDFVYHFFGLRPNSRGVGTTTATVP
jgi:protein involved in polysaccharide export with SLBB domain